jgi:D-psicose/D-tagatose/L-ribulose 3-epimerase
LSENDRGTLGQGHLPWPEVFATLREIDYQGWLSVEAFSPKLAVANIWRPLFTDEAQLMRDSLAFLQTMTNHG